MEQRTKIAVPPLDREYLTKIPLNECTYTHRYTGRTRQTLLLIQAAAPRCIRISVSAASQQPAAL